MSAVQELRELVDRLSEDEASEWLSRMRAPGGSTRPTFVSLLRASEAERSAFVAAFPPDVDAELVADWDEVASDGLDAIDR